MRLLALIVLGASSVIEPITLEWRLALGLAIAITVCGSISDIYSRHGPGFEATIPKIVGSVGLSCVAAFTFFTVIRLRLSDSLQAAALSGICGMYGRRGLEKLVGEVLNRIGVGDDDVT